MSESLAQQHMAQGETVRGEGLTHCAFIVGGVRTFDIFGDHDTGDPSTKPEIDISQGHPKPEMGEDPNDRGSSDENGPPDLGPDLGLNIHQPETPGENPGNPFPPNVPPDAIIPPQEVPEMTRRIWDELDQPVPAP